jgi:uncharacterized membrane protein YccC
MHVPSLPRFPLPLSRHLKSHHAISGLGCAFGVMLLTLLAYALLGARAAIAVSTGALVVSLADLPLPRRNKLPLLLANFLQAPLVTLLIELTHPSPAALGAAVLLISFASAMVTGWGRFSLPLGYSMVMVMAFSMARPDMTSQELLAHLALQASGGLLYIGYAMMLTRWIDMLMRRRVMVDALYGFSDYLRCKADVFDATRPLDDVFVSLVRRQSRFVEKLQTARDFILDGRRTPRQAALAAGMFALMDVHEEVLSIQPDYARLRRHFGGHAVMRLLAATMRALAHDVERLADSGLQAGSSVLADTPYRNTRPALERLLAEMRRTATAGDIPRLAVLDEIHGKLRAAVEGLRRCESLMRGRTAPAAPLGADMQRFLSRSSFAPRALQAEVRLDSPVLRYALRLTLAMLAAYLISLHLPYATHGYWILLTVALVMRASFSQTRRRQADRMVGNALGCLLTALLLHWVSSPLALLLVIFVCIAIAHAYISERYRYTVTAACVMALLQLHLIAPGTFHIAERLFDTTLGVAIAYVFSRVLPSWERHSLPALNNRLLGALQAYIPQALNLEGNDLRYRFARRQVHEALAALSEAIVRMRDEPSTQHLPLATLNTLTTQTYLLMTHLASARRLIAAGHQRPADATDAAGRRLTALLDIRHPPRSPIPADDAVQMNEPPTESPDAPLDQRLARAAEDIRVLMGAARTLGVS